MLGLRPVVVPFTGSPTMFKVVLCIFRDDFIDVLKLFPHVFLDRGLIFF